MAFCERFAFGALRGVGDPKLGQWRERGPIAFHLRRRISADEQEIIGPAIDIRGTMYEELRLEAVKIAAPDAWARFAGRGPRVG